MRQHCSAEGRMVIWIQAFAGVDHERPHKIDCTIFRTMPCLQGQTRLQMRAALIFPPQWDPRHPPLAPAVLAATLQTAGADTRVFDLNLALYRRLLDTTPGGNETFLLQRLLDPASLTDASHYLQISEKVQQLFDERFDPHGYGRLFWDTCRSHPARSSADWQTILYDPGKITFIRHLDSEIADIVEWRPDLLGISIISDTQLPAALALAAIFRRRLPDCRIVAGGDAITYRRSLLPEHSWLQMVFDILCAGDGEPMLQALATGTLSGKVPNSIKWAADSNSSQSCEELQNLSRSLRPDFTSLPLQQYMTPHLVMPIETARGCPWGRCAYCIHPVRGATGRPLYRPKPLKLVAEEIAALYTAGHRRFFIVDEAIPPARLLELAAIFVSLPGPVAWIGYCRLDEGHTREGFIKAKAAGCRKLFIGVESGSDKILKQFNKGVTATRARRVLLDIAAAGLAAHFFLMTGFPGESETDRQATLDLLADVLPAFDPFGVSFDLFPLTGELETDLMANPTAYGWNAPQHNQKHNLDWQFPLLTGPAATETLANFKTRIHELADRIAGPAFGLRHAALAQDSLHLLLLEARSQQ